MSDFVFEIAAIVLVLGFIGFTIRHFSGFRKGAGARNLERLSTLVDGDVIEKDKGKFRFTYDGQTFTCKLYIEKYRTYHGSISTGSFMRVEGELNNSVDGEVLIYRKMISQKIGDLFRRRHRRHISIQSHGSRYFIYGGHLTWLEQVQWTDEQAHALKYLTSQYGTVYITRDRICVRASIYNSISKYTLNKTTQHLHELAKLVDERQSSSRTDA